MDWENEKTVVDDDSHSGQFVVPPDDGPGVGFASRDHSTLDEPTVDEPRGLLPALSPSGKNRTQVPQAAIGKLAIIAGKDRGREYDLTGKTISVGRGLDNDVVLTDIAVSRKHMSIKFDGMRYGLVDHESGNGTLVNDEMRPGSFALTHGDRIEIGNTVLRLEHLPSKRASKRQESSTLGHAPTQPANRAAIPPPPVRRSQPVGADAEARRSRGSVPLPRREPAPPARQSAPVSLPSAPIADRNSPLMTPQQRLSAPMSTPELAVTGVPGPLGPSSVPPQHVTTGGAGVERPVLQPGGLMLGNNAPVPLGPPEFERPDSAIPEVHSSTGPEPSYPSATSLPHGIGIARASSFPQMSAPDPYLSPADMQLTPKRTGKILAVIALIVGLVVIGGGVGLYVKGLGKSADGSTTEQPGIATDEPAGDSLPISVWGTDETILATSGGGAKVAPGDEKPDAARHPEEAEPPDEPEEAEPLPDEPDQPADPEPQSVVRDEPSSDEPSVRRTSPNTVRNKARQQYNARNFTKAASTLRGAAGKVSNKEGARLRDLAADYEAVGDARLKGDAAATGKPIDAMRFYERAVRLDKASGGGAHASFFRGKLKKVTPRAAAAYLSKGSLESAKKTADKAAKYGAGSDSELKNVRTQLDRRAAALYKEGLTLKNKNKAEARKRLQRVLKIVPEDNKWYDKSRKFLVRLR